MSSDEMQSFHISRLALLAILAGSLYASEPPTQIIKDVGEDFEAAVATFSDVVDECYITMPSTTNVLFMPNNDADDKFELLESSDVVGCRVRIRNLDKNDNGLWTMHTVSSEGSRLSQSYNVTVNSAADSDASEGNTTPPELIVENLDELRFDTKLGATHRIQIPSFDFVNTENCFAITPEEVRVDLESQDIPGLEIIKDQNTACGVALTLQDEALIGQWFLISRELRWSTERVERRLPFVIHVTEEVDALPKEISVIQNKDFYVRLANVSGNPDTCKLLGPDGSVYDNFESDPRYVDTCGFAVRRVNETDSGRWQIVYGDRITYSAPFEVSVHTSDAQGQDQNQLFVWIRDKPVHEIVGPVDASYCKVIDPQGFVVYEEFGRCNITLPRATDEHEGNWKMFVGIRGRVLTEEATFTVKITNGSPKPVVKTEVTANKPAVTLSCSVSSPYPIRACKFRDPSGRILMANPGVGEDRYTYHGNGSSYESGVYTHDCGIQITNPIIRDLGIWRCAIETDDETYYGFLTAWCPWATKDPEVAASILGAPVLTADRTPLEVVEGDNVLMSCSVQSAIRYCYFRASNGTVYNVGPGFSSTDMGEYAGAGLDAGECGIRFRSLSENNNRGWSCHVGFHDLDMAEQRADFNVDVNEIMRVTRTRTTIRIVVDGRRSLDYCRFVRSDGFGFSSDAVPAPYFVKAFLHIGECTLSIFEPTTVDRRPWTVVARITGHKEEITRITNSNVVNPPPTSVMSYRMNTLWLVFLLSGVIMIVFAALLTPKKNRNWTYSKASGIRNSFRQRFAKKAVVKANTTENNTANAA